MRRLGKYIHTRIDFNNIDIFADEYFRMSAHARIEKYQRLLKLFLRGNTLHSYIYIYVIDMYVIYIVYSNSIFVYV